MIAAPHNLERRGMKPSLRPRERHVDAQTKAGPHTVLPKLPPQFAFNYKIVPITKKHRLICCNLLGISSPYDVVPTFLSQQKMLAKEGASICELLQLMFYYQTSHLSS